MGAATDRPAADRSPLLRRLGDATNILLLAPPIDSRSDEACMNLLTAAAPAHEDVLCVSLTRSATDRLKLWHTHVGDDAPANTGLVSVDGSIPSLTFHPEASPHVGDSVSIKTVSNPADLTGLGIALVEYITEWEADDNQIVACFHSITTLLQYTDLDCTFRFLNVCTKHFDAADAVAHYHMDPRAHDEQTVDTLKQLFDASVEIDDDDEWLVTTR